MRAGLCVLLPRAQTAMLVAEGLNIKGGFSVEELVRETLGEDTCDARRCVRACAHISG